MDTPRVRRAPACFPTASPAFFGEAGVPKAPILQGFLAQKRARFVTPSISDIVLRRHERRDGPILLKNALVETVKAH